MEIGPLLVDEMMLKYGNGCALLLLRMSSLSKNLKNKKEDVWRMPKLRIAAATIVFFIQEFKNEKDDV